jgi:hypothetical protein
MQFRGQDHKSTIVVPVKLLVDWSSKTKYLAYFIPGMDPIYSLTVIACTTQNTIDLIEERATAANRFPGESSSILSKNLPFSRTVYIYYDDSMLSLQQIRWTGTNYFNSAACLSHSEA